MLAAPYTKHHNNFKGHDDNVRPDNSSSQISDSLTLLNNIPSQFDEKYTEREAYEKNLHEQHEMVLLDYKALKSQNI